MFTESALAEKLGIIQQTVNTWISDIRARQKASRNTVIIRLSRLACPPSFWRAWPQEKISETIGLSQNRVSKIIGNTNFGNIDNLLSQGHDMDYIARHYNMDLALARPPRLSEQPPWLKPNDPPVIGWHWLAGAGQARDGGQAWALRLQGKTDQEKFKELGWGLPREIRESDSETYFTGGCAHGINGILTNVYPVKLRSKFHGVKLFNWGLPCEILPISLWRISLGPAL